MSAEMDNWADRALLVLLEKLSICEIKILAENKINHDIIDAASDQILRALKRYEKRYTK